MTPGIVRLKLLIPMNHFFAPEEFEALCKDEGEDTFKYDWPPYGPAMEDDHFIQKVRKKIFCSFVYVIIFWGKVLDLMDKYNMWG